MVENEKVTFFTQQLDQITAQWTRVVWAGLICGFGFGIMVGVLVSKLW